MNYSKQELYNRYDLIVNSIIKEMYYQSGKDYIIFDYRNKYKGRKLYFEIAKIIQNIDPNKIIYIDSNLFTYVYLKIKNRKLKIKRNTEYIRCFDSAKLTQSILDDWMLGDDILDKIYEAYYKKGAKIEI